MIKNSGIYRFLRSWLYVKPKMDGAKFIESWQSVYGSFHDPSPPEVIERLKLLKLNRVMEIGSGYGRIAIPLASSGFEVTCLEPDELIALETKKMNINTLVSRIQDLESIEAKFGDKFDCIISIRVVSYLSLIETIKMLRFLEKISDVFIGWEEYVGSRRLRMARFFVKKIKVVVIETLN
jgi:SAM-dependent methyltransferase